MQNKNKNHLTFTEQISLLKDRGLNISNDTEVADLLQCVSYYRLNSYRFPFWAKNKQVFLENTNFNDLYVLYKTDSIYKNMLLDVIHHIEVAFRTQLIYYFSQIDKYFYYNEKTYSGSDVRVFVSHIKNQVKNCNNVHIVYYKEQECSHNNFKGCNCYPESWIALEAIDFGTIVDIYSRANDKYDCSKLAIGKFFKLKTPKELRTFMIDIRRIRNIVAHYDKIIDRYRFSESASMPYLKYYYDFSNINNKAVERSFLPYFLAIKHIVESLLSNSSLLSELCSDKYIAFLDMSKVNKGLLNLNNINESVFLYKKS